MTCNTHSSYTYSTDRPVCLFPFSTWPGEISLDLREKIIQESLKLFSLKGFLSTSIHDVLEAAGTSKGGLYNHFMSKEDLFFAVLGCGPRDLAATDARRP